MKKATLMVAGVIVALWGSGCATIVSGGRQDIHITSDPPGVRVKADTGVEIVTPGELNLPRNKHHTLVAESPGAEPQQKELRCGLNGWVFGNILFGGVIGIVIDIVSGAHGDLSPDTVHFDFTEAGQAGELRKKSYLASHPDLRLNTRYAILYERPAFGMKSDELVAAFGEPDEIVQDGRYQKYVYENRQPRYWYIRKGVIQRTEK